MLCDNCPEESMMHLFFECSFSQSFWWALGIDWNCDYNITDMIQEAKTRYSINFIMDIVVVFLTSTPSGGPNGEFRDVGTRWRVDESRRCTSLPRFTSHDGGENLLLL